MLFTGEDIPLVDIYYKIEDKWFDLLDWMEAHHIPAYKVVDPLEKRGIPSLPVFVALVLILIYLLLGPLNLLSGGGSSGNFQLRDTNGACIANAHISFSGDETYETDIDKDCNANVNLAPGEYKLTVTKEGCRKATADVTLSEPPNQAQIDMACGDMSEINLCFSPRRVGIVNAISYENEDYYDSQINCGTDKCALLLESGLTYKFESSDNYISGRNYSSSELEAMAAANTCLNMVEKPVIIDQEATNIIVQVKGPAGSLVPAAKVNLVNPNSASSIIESRTTGAQGASLGQAFFDITVGTVFKVAVEATNSTASYLGSQIYNVTEEPFQINITLLNSGTSSITVFDNTTKQPIPNVYITLFESNEVNKSTVFTDNNGKSTFGLRIGTAYRAALFKGGYKYTELAINAEESKTVYLEQVAEEDVGMIQAMVLFKDTEIPVEGASLTLKKDGKSTGYYADITGADGASTFTNVLPGSYCVLASRTVGEPSDCETVTVSADSESAVEVYIPQSIYRLKVGVKMPDGTAVKTANVLVTDDSEIFPSLSNNTNSLGQVTFSIPEANTGITISVYYKALDGKVYDVSQHFSKITEKKSTTITLYPSENSIMFDGAVDFRNGDPIDLSTTILNAGSVYSFVFSLGLYDIQGSKPDAVNFNVRDSRGLLEFIPQSDFDWLSASSAAATSALTYTASGNFDRNSRTVIAVPVRVKQVFAETKIHNFTYNATWVQGSNTIKDPASGDYKTPSFQIRAGYCAKYGDFGVCKYLIKGSGSAQLKPNTATVSLSDIITLGYEITNEGSNAFDGDVEIDDTKESLVFKQTIDNVLTSVSINRSDGSISDVKAGGYTITANKLTVTGAEGWGSELNLEHGDTLIIKTRAQIVSPSAQEDLAPRSFITAKAGTQDIGNVSFSIEGDSTPEIEFDSNFYDSLGNVRLFDITPAMYFSFKEKESDKDVMKWRIWMGDGTVSSVGGDALVCGASNTIDLKTSVYSMNKQWNTPDFAVEFDQGCRLQSGSLKVNLSGPMQSLKEKEWTYTVGDCLEFPTDMSTTMNKNDRCEVKFDINPSNTEAKVVQPSGGRCNTTDPLKVYVKTCKNSLPGSATVISTVNTPQQAGTIATTGGFTYDSDVELKTVDIAVQLTAKTNAFNENKDELKSTYQKTVKITIAEKQGSGTLAPSSCSLWTPKKILKYTTATPDCSNSYCNMDQVLNWLKADITGLLDGTTTVAGRNFKLVNQPLTSQAITDIMNGMTEFATNVISATTTPVYGGPGSLPYVVDSSAGANKGENAVTFGTYIDDDGNKHVLLNFSPTSDPTTLNKIDSVQLDIIHQNGYSSDIVVDNSVPLDVSPFKDSNGIGLRWRDQVIYSVLNGVLTNMYGTAAGATVGSHKMKAEICDLSNTQSTICKDLLEFTGAYSSAIYETGSGQTVHFAANSTDNLYSLIQNFSVAVRDLNGSVLEMKQGPEVGYLTIARDYCANPTVAFLCGDGEITGTEECDGTKLGTCTKCKNTDCMCARKLVIGAVSWTTGCSGFGKTKKVNNTLYIYDSNSYTEIDKYTLPAPFYTCNLMLSKAVVNSNKNITIFSLGGASTTETSNNLYYLTKPNPVASGLPEFETMKRVNLAEGHFVDFALVYWNNDDKLDLALLNATSDSAPDATNAITIIYDIEKLMTDTPDGTKISVAALANDPTTGQILSMLPVPEPFSMLKATYIDGVPSLAVMRAGGDAYGRIDFLRHTWENTYCKVVIYPAGAKDANAYTKFFTIDPAGGESTWNVGGDSCADFDFADLDNTGKNKLVMLTRFHQLEWAPGNKLYVFDLSKITDEQTIPLTEASDATLGYTVTDIGSLNAGDIYTGDVNGDGSDEILVVAGQGDVNTYSHSITKISSSTSDVANYGLVIYDRATQKFPRIA